MTFNIVKKNLAMAAALVCSSFIARAEIVGGYIAPLDVDNQQVQSSQTVVINGSKTTKPSIDWASIYANSASTVVPPPNSNSINYATVAIAVPNMWGWSDQKKADRVYFLQKAAELGRKYENSKNTAKDLIAKYNKTSDSAIRAQLAAQIRAQIAIIVEGIFTYQAMIDAAEQYGIISEEEYYAHKNAIDIMQDTAASLAAFNVKATVGNWSVSDVVASDMTMTGTNTVRAKAVLDKRPCPTCALQ